MERPSFEQQKHLVREEIEEEDIERLMRLYIAIETRQRTGKEKRGQYINIMEEQTMERILENLSTESGLVSFKKEIQRIRPGLFEQMEKSEIQQKCAESILSNPRGYAEELKKRRNEIFRNRDVAFGLAGIMGAAATLDLLGRNRDYVYYYPDPLLDAFFATDVAAYDEKKNIFWLIQVKTLKELEDILVMTADDFFKREEQLSSIMRYEDRKKIEHGLAVLRRFISALGKNYKEKFIPILAGLPSPQSRAYPEIFEKGTGLPYKEIPAMILPEQ